jgi:hypothetical protein
MGSIAKKAAITAAVVVVTLMALHYLAPSSVKTMTGTN